MGRDSEGPGRPLHRASSIAPDGPENLEYGISSDHFDLGALDFPTSDNVPGDDTALQHHANADFERFGPAALVSTQTAEQSQWVRETLDHEANNFLDFVKAAVAKHDTAEHGRVTFEELLPPSQNTNIVAAQGLLHVLSLATRGELEVTQDGAFQDITLQPREKDWHPVYDCTEGGHLLHF